MSVPRILKALLCPNTGTSYFNIMQLRLPVIMLTTISFSVQLCYSWTLSQSLSSGTTEAGTTSFFQSGKQPACFGHHHSLDSNNMNSVPGTKSRRSVVFDPPDPHSELQGKIKMQPTSTTRKFLPDPKLATKGTQNTSQSCICFLHYSNCSNKNIFQIHNGQ